MDFNLIVRGEILEIFATNDTSVAADVLKKDEELSKAGICFITWVIVSVFLHTCVKVRRSNNSIKLTLHCYAPGLHSIRADL